MSKFKTPTDVWAAIDKGLTVFAGNESYKVYVEENIGNEEQRTCAPRMFSARGNQVLSVRCIANYFGSVLHPSDLNDLFIKETENE